MESRSSLLERLSLLYPESSKNTLRSWIEQGRVLLAGQVAFQAKQLVNNSEAITLAPRKQFIEEKVEILFEDSDLVVINKPAGLLSVATDFQKWHTAHTLLKRRFHRGRVYPVHRLDRDTSGVMLFAYSVRARDAFKALFKAHAIEREYIAVVEGIVADDRGTWQSYLREDGACNVHSSPREGEGQLAITHYEVIKRNKSSTALRLTLETGRKNQIRVQSKAAGHPVVGDKKYQAEAHFAGRLCLHASRLGFIHPVSDKRYTFTSPVPLVLQKFL